MPSHRITLPADASSCPAARRFVVDVLKAAPEEIRDSAGLLTSEAVTNALLHAAGPIIVDVKQHDDRYRIEVRDASRLPPTEKHHEPEDLTGRGVRLLNKLATAWGWQPTRSGKVVWFDLVGTMDGTVMSNVAPTPRGPDGHDPYSSGAEIELIGAPVRAMIRAGAHYDALYREFRLMLEADPSLEQHVPGRVLRLMDALGSDFLGFGSEPAATWERAVREGRDKVDLCFRLPAAAAPIVERYGGLLDDADSYCQEAHLTTIIATPETVAVRRWAFDEVAGQCRGGRPTPWPGVTS